MIQITEEGWAGIVHDDRGYSADVNLAPGFALTNTWDAVPDAWYWGNSKKPPAHTCGVTCLPRVLRPSTQAYTTRQVWIWRTLTLVRGCSDTP